MNSSPASWQGSGPSDTYGSNRAASFYRTMSWVSSTYAREQPPDDDLDPVSTSPVALVSNLVPSGISAAKVYPSPGSSLAICDMFLSFPTSPMQLK